ncbi:MAG: hypothetical protein EXS39_01285 [Opitutaceae bacterium]|nr:hypothetical protein [Opitutaceae bacterium]
MKYFFCKFHGPRPTFGRDTTPTEEKLLQEHVVYLRNFAEQGAVVVFGSVTDPRGFFGIVVWELPDEADINAICAGDPAIKSGLGFRYEIHPMPRAVLRDRLAEKKA